MTLVKIGSGSASLDTNLKDGFSNFILNKKIKEKILIVEANSIHIANLNKFWKFSRNTKIFNLAITPDNTDMKKMTFFYSEEDAPNYQIFSNSKSFVLEHFPMSEINQKIVNCLSISKFFKKNKLRKIMFLSLDIEGMDYEVLLNLDLKKFEIKHISFEHLHLTIFQKINIILKFIKNDYYFSGMGFDIRKSDWMFSKSFKGSKIKTFFLPLMPRRIWKNFLFSKYIQ